MVGRVGQVRSAHSTLTRSRLGAGDVPFLRGAESRWRDALPSRVRSRWALLVHRQVSTDHAMTTTTTTTTSATDVTRHPKVEVGRSVRQGGRLFKIQQRLLDRYLDRAHRGALRC